MFEAFVMALAREMPVAAISGLVAEHDTRPGASQHYVSQAHDQQDWSHVTAVAIDETATRGRGHRYATVVVQMMSASERAAPAVHDT
ncbi:hypothetical protein [Prosthecobacter sp.]|uniref:hypothetical protein n=1 Tax=Prosthecobacter sp. TaxID=1965333 RepID=UPI0037850E9C